MEEPAPKQDESSSSKNTPQSAAGEATSGTPPKASSASAGSFASPPTSQGTKTAAATPKPSHSLEDANKEISELIASGKISSDDVPAIRAILKEHVSLKDKIDKLKSLLGRSAKAQRETKVDLEVTQKRMSQALREIDRLNQKLEKLQSRPTHRKSDIHTASKN